MNVADVAANRPRRCAGACSVMNDVEPVNSPPPEKPWTSRRTASRTGASTPIEAYVGSSPIRKVDSPMIVRVTRKAYLRPIRSPMRPKTSAPNGRTMKPVAKSAHVLISAQAGFPLGNISSDMITARLPKM